MRPISQTLSGPAATLVIPLDVYEDPFQVSVDCVVNGAVTYQVGTSNDDPWTGQPPTNVNSLIASGSVNAQQTITAPVRQLYVQVTAGTGSVTVRVVQSGARGG